MHRHACFNLFYRFNVKHEYVRNYARVHYGRMDISRVSSASPSVKNRALGEEHLPRVLHSGKKNTRGRETLALADENWYLTAEIDGATLKTFFPECYALALGEASLFPVCLILALGEEFFFF
jgi:hypothetical protein